MNFNNIFLKSFRVLLLPFAALYWFVIYFRNLFYDKGWFGSAHFNFPIICIGNLAVGGTGKSPMVEYLIKLLKPNYKIATLSRGYKRKTKGYTLANKNTTALEIGDEPMQFYLKNPDLAVAVGEERIVAIPHLLQDVPDLEAIILDDAFQHRSVTAGLNILLTEFSNLYTSDFFIPTGDLRDEKSSANRAQIIVVTKCPPTLNEEEKAKILREIKPLPSQHVFFTSISYGILYHISDPADRCYLTPNDEVLLVCGIANPKPLKDHLLNNTHAYYQLDYSNHHIFSIDDLKEIVQKFDTIQAKDKIIITTEKDAVRLIKFNDQLKDIPIYVIPIQHVFLFNEGPQFDDMLINYVEDFNFNTL